MELKKSRLLITDKEKFFNWINKTFIKGFYFEFNGRWFTMSTGRLLPLIIENTMTVCHHQNEIIFEVIPISWEIVRIDAICRSNNSEFTAIFEDVWDEVLYQFKQHLPYEKPKQKRGPQSETADKLRRLREIRLNAITNNRPIPVRVAAMNEAGITAKTVKKYDQELWAKWNDKNYK